jgi:AhpD family alkylhydroperoxidase
MKKIEVFDPAMCCSTGVCGPSVDPELARFAGDAGWLSARGGVVERFNLAQQPGAFAERDVVREALRVKGEECLPLMLADGEIVREGSYPTRDELVALAGVDMPLFSYTPQVDELVAIAAAVASNCEPCLEYHVGVARELGVANEEIARAVATARKVKDTPARHILRVADELLGAGSERAASDSEGALPLVQEPASNGGCGCSSNAVPDEAVAAAASSSKCC